MYLSMLAAPWPKRRVTIFTSSGWETSLGIFLLVLDSRPVLVKNSGNVVRAQIVMECVIHLDGRRPAAHSDALDFFERKNAVGRDSLVPDAQLFLETLVQVVSPTQHAADIGANLHVEFARRLESQHGIVAGDVAYFEGGDRKLLSDFFNHRIGEVADLIVPIEQHRDEGGALDGILRHQRVET